VSRGESAGPATLADEQAALRRVATLVASGAAPNAVFDLVTQEASRLLGVPILTMIRYGPDRTATVISAASDKPFPVGTTLALDGPSVIATILETGETARIESYEGLSGEIAAGLRAAGARSAYGVPIVVDGELWGAMAAIQTAAVPDAESRLADFTELVASAISNAQAREDLRYLAAEQASLRRVATLVAHHAPSDELFALVGGEVKTLLGVPFVAVTRYEGRRVTVVGAAGGNPHISLGGSWTLDGPSVSATVLDTGRSARMDEYTGLAGEVAAIAQTAGFQSVAGAPIVVAGHVWGAIIAVSTSDPLPDRSETRIAEYTELVATAISNAATTEELVTSRARIVAASDEGRRRLERDLHDGTQQRLIALALDIQRLRTRLPVGDATTANSLSKLQNEIESILEELQELSRGLHPALLARGGLLPPLQALARRSPIPVDLHVTTEQRPPEPVEIATYYAVAEALTNAIKHSHASQVTIEIQSADGMLRASVRDDGIGGANAGDGTGLIGLTDRIAALGGTLHLHSPPHNGTIIEIELPYAAHGPTSPG